jgi:hypothetical protein
MADTRMYCPLPLRQARLILKNTGDIVTFIVARKSPEAGARAPLHHILNNSHAPSPGVPAGNGHALAGASAQGASAFAEPMHPDTQRRVMEWHNNVVSSLFGEDPQRDMQREEAYQRVQLQRQMRAEGLDIQHLREMTQFVGETDTELRDLQKRIASLEMTRKSMDMTHLSADEIDAPGVLWASQFNDRVVTIHQMVPESGKPLGLNVYLGNIPHTPLHLAGGRCATHLPALPSTHSPTTPQCTGSSTLSPSAK